jgi:hypothetical protein
MPIHGHPIPRPPGRGKALWVVCWKPTLNTFAIIFEGGIVSIAVHLTDAMISYTRDRTLPPGCISAPFRHLPAKRDRIRLV